MMMSAPAPARPTAMARPIPAVDPVTSAVFPETSIFMRHLHLADADIGSEPRERNRPNCCFFDFSRPSGRHGRRSGHRQHVDAGNRRWSRIGHAYPVPALMLGTIERV